MVGKWEVRADEVCGRCGGREVGGAGTDRRLASSKHHIVTCFI